MCGMNGFESCGNLNCERQSSTKDMVNPYSLVWEFYWIINYLFIDIHNHTKQALQVALTYKVILSNTQSFWTIFLK